MDWVASSDKIALVPACIAAAELCLGAVEVEPAAGQVLAAGLAAAREWLRCPCVDHALAAERAHELASALDVWDSVGMVIDGQPAPPLHWLIWLVCGATGAATEGWLDHDDPAPRSSGTSCVVALNIMPAGLVRDVLCKAVIDWALDRRLPGSSST